MKKNLLIFLTIFIQACAFTDATLDVSHDPEASFVGPLEQIESLTFSDPILEDKRVDRDRIGWKKNGYGMNTADIMTAEPVTDIVSKAITAGLSDNGHKQSENGRIAISGTLNRFWFETDMNFWTVEFIGDVQCSLNFVDTLTNTTIYSSDYAGNYSEKKAGGLNKTWQRIMGKAVDKLVEDIIFDEDLLEAIESLPDRAEE